MCSIPCGCITKGGSVLLPIVDYYLKELCNTIIKFKEVFACYRCFIATYNMFIMAWLLYLLWLTNLVFACSQDLIHVIYGELVMHSYHITISIRHCSSLLLAWFNRCRDLRSLFWMALRT